MPRRARAAALRIIALPLVLLIAGVGSAHTQLQTVLLFDLICESFFCRRFHAAQGSDWLPGQQNERYRRSTFATTANTAHAIHLPRHDAAQRGAALLMLAFGTPAVIPLLTCCDRPYPTCCSSGTAHWWHPLVKAASSGSPTYSSFCYRSHSFAQRHVSKAHCP
jgi:hypothetical protein